MASAKKHAKEFRKQVIEKVGTLIISAFGLVAALAWNTTIQAAVTKFLGTSGSQLAGLLVYALVVTIIAILATIYISKLSEKIKG